MSVISARSLPPWLAGVVQDLELQGALLVTVEDILRSRPDLSRTMARLGLAELAKRGWLQRTGARGTYEFIPGAAGGSYPSGDPWIVLRAALTRHPDAFHVGATSAAWLLGYAQRSPEWHVVVTFLRQTPPSLRAAYRVLHMVPSPADAVVNGVPVPTPPQLFAEIAQLAPRLSLDAAKGWLRRLLADVSAEDAVAVLQDRNVSTRARAGFFASLCGCDAIADAIAPLVDAKHGPFYTGPQGMRGSFSARWRVYDTGHVGSA